MSDHTKKIVSMMDELALRCEENGEFKTAVELDTISMLVVAASSEIPAGVSRLADDLQKHFPRMGIERALHTARTLYAAHDCSEEEPDEDAEAEEKEGGGTGAGGILPLNAYPGREKRQGPRPQDVPIGTPEWWKE
jgi:hypothetical protein